MKEKLPSRGVLRNRSSDDFRKNLRKTPATDIISVSLLYVPMIMKSTLCLEYFSEFFVDFQNELYCETYERPLLSGEITKTLNSKMFGMNFNCLQLCYGHFQTVFVQYSKSSFSKQALDFNSVQSNQIEFSQNSFSALALEI